MGGGGMESIKPPKTKSWTVQHGTQKMNHNRRKETNYCEYGETETIDHLLIFPLIETTCDKNYLHLANEKTVAIVAFWKT